MGTVAGVVDMLPGGPDGVVPQVGATAKVDMVYVDAAVEDIRVVT